MSIGCLKQVIKKWRLKIKESKMDNHIRKLVANVLKKLDFVNWDRYFGENGCWTFFGWIDREKDNYKDFVTLDFQLEKNDILISYATSSARTNRRN